MADNNPNLATPYDPSSGGDQMPSKPHDSGDGQLDPFQRQLVEREEKPGRQYYTQAPDPQVGEAPSDQVSPVGYPDPYTEAYPDSARKDFEGSQVEQEPIDTPPEATARSKQSFPFCLCCCFLVLLIVVAVLGLGIYSYSTGVEIPVISEILEKIEIASEGGGEEENGQEPEDGEEPEEPEPSINWLEYGMEEFGLSISLPQTWEFENLNRGKVRAGQVMDYLREPDSFEEDEMVELVQYKVSNPDEELVIGVLIGLYIVCSEEEISGYECIEEEYEFSIQGQEQSCVASALVKQGATYNPNTAYNFFSCGIVAHESSMWKNIKIISQTLSDQDLAREEIKTIIESIDEV